MVLGSSLWTISSISAKNDCFQVAGSLVQNETEVAAAVLLSSMQLLI